jgi:hypothetical protein
VQILNAGIVVISGRSRGRRALAADLPAATMIRPAKITAVTAVITTIGRPRTNP